MRKDTMALEPTDKVGKVYRAELDARGRCTLRRCLVCDELFSREAAAEHAKVTCYPKPTDVYCMVTN